MIETMPLNLTRANTQVTGSPITAPFASENFEAMLPETASTASGELHQGVPIGLFQAVSNLSTDLQSLLIYLQSDSSTAPGTQQAVPNTKSSPSGAAVSSQNATLSPIDQANTDIGNALASLQAAADRQTAEVEAFTARIDAIGNSLSTGRGSVSPSDLGPNTAQLSNSRDGLSGTPSANQNGNGFLFGTSPIGRLMVQNYLRRE